MSIPLRPSACAGCVALGVLILTPVPPAQANNVDILFVADRGWTNRIGFLDGFTSELTTQLTAVGFIDNQHDRVGDRGGGAPCSYGFGAACGAEAFIRFNGDFSAEDAQRSVAAGLSVRF